MKSSRVLLFAVTTISLFHAVAAAAAHVDMNDPRRALGREDDVRIDAQLVQDTVTSGSPVGVTVQIQNLSQQPIAVADKVCDLSYDNESRTISLSVGAEVPKNNVMPRLVLVGAGEKKTFAVGAVLHVVQPTTRSPFISTPQQVEIKVNFIRELAPFQSLIDQQARSAAPIMLSDQQFDQWIDSSDTIFLNAIPVSYVPKSRSNMDADASQRQGGMF